MPLLDLWKKELLMMNNKLSLTRLIPNIWNVNTEMYCKNNNLKQTTIKFIHNEIQSVFGCLASMLEHIYSSFSPFRADTFLGHGWRSNSPAASHPTMPYWPSPSQKRNWSRPSPNIFLHWDGHGDLQRSPPKGRKRVTG